MVSEKLAKIYPLLGGVWLASIVCLTQDSCVNPTILILFFLCAVWMLFWLARFLGMLVPAFRSREASEFKVNWYYWCFEPVILVLGLFIASYQPSRLIHLALAKPSLTAYVHDVQARNVFAGRAVGPASVALYNVYHVDVVDDGSVWLLTCGNGIKFTCGFVYSPGSHIPSRCNSVIKHALGPWWYWTYGEGQQLRDFSIRRISSQSLNKCNL